MSADVLSKEQFEREWHERTKLAPAVAPAPRAQAPLHGVAHAQHVEPIEVLRVLARPLLAAALEALLDFDAVEYRPRSQRRIRRK